MQSQPLAQSLPEEPVYFDQKALDQLFKSMGFNECVYLEEAAKFMLKEVANDFMTNLLEQSLQISYKRAQSEENKTTKFKLGIEDIKYVLKNRLRVPVHNFHIDRENN